MSYLERLDILDEDGNKTGEDELSTIIHEKGLIHRAVHVWIVNSKGELLLQKRGPNMRAHPNEWDISASGHIPAGKTSEEGAFQEVEEETGLSLQKGQLEFLYTVRTHALADSGTYIVNEFQDVYLVRLDVLIEDLIPQASEVTEFRWIDISTLKEWLAGNGESIVPHDQEYKQLFDVLAK